MCDMTCSMGPRLPSHHYRPIFLSSAMAILQADEKKETEQQIPPPRGPQSLGPQGFCGLSEPQPSSQEWRAVPGTELPPQPRANMETFPIKIECTQERKGRRRKGSQARFPNPRDQSRRCDRARLPCRPRSSERLVDGALLTCSTSNSAKARWAARKSVAS